MPTIRSKKAKQQHDSISQLLSEMEKPKVVLQKTKKPMDKKNQAKLLEADKLLANANMYLDAIANADVSELVIPKYTSKKYDKRNQEKRILRVQKNSTVDDDVYEEETKVPVIRRKKATEQQISSPISQLLNQMEESKDSSLQNSQDLHLIWLWQELP